MTNNFLNLLSVPALAIALMASTSTNVDAQCSNGCFGYPTPNRSVVQSYAPAVQYQVAPAATFYQPPVFIQPQQFATGVPIEQTFVDQPIIVQPMPMTVAPQYSPLPVVPSQSWNIYHPPTTMDRSGDLIGQSELTIPVPPIPVPANNMEGMQEEQIEGEIISATDNASDSSMSKEDTDGEPPLNESTEKSTQEEAEGETPEMDKPEMDKPEMDKPEMDKPEMERAEMEKAETESTEMEKTAPEEMVKSEKIAVLETSLKQQSKRAKQQSMREFGKQLNELKADGDISDAKIESLKEESAAALKAKLNEIEERVQGRIDRLNN